MTHKLWTPSQERAITARGVNLLVSAAAGAGKTAVLVERIIRRVTSPDDPVDIDTLLVVTFTNAAAAEMRQRIGTALARALDEDPGSGHLARQAALVTRAPIMTLHAFCLDVLRRNFHRLDLDPAFRVADDTEAALLRQDALEELFEARYASGEPSFLALVDIYGGPRDDSRLQEIVLRLHDFAHSHPWPMEWLAGAAGAFDVPADQDLDALPWTGEVRRHLATVLQGAHRAVVDALAQAQAPGGPAPYVPVLMDDLAALERLLAAVEQGEPWEALREAFTVDAFKRLPACRGGEIDPVRKANAQKWRQKAKDAFSELCRTFFARPAAELLTDLRRVAPAMRSLADLAREFAATYSRIKRGRGLLDFHDLEHLCLQVLIDPGSTPGCPRPSETALACRERFTEVLVDEYQDINAVQETILQLVSRQGTAEPNLFMVGDVKQSIYRFRLAEPALFLRKYAAYGRHGGPGIRIDLPDNFRCRRGVVTAVNFVFRQIMTAASGEIPYDDRTVLVCRASYPAPPQGAPTLAGPVEVHLIDRSLTGGRARQAEDGEEVESEGEGEASADYPVPAEDLDALQVEARAVARRIRRMVEEERPLVYDPDAGGYRPLTYRDVTVLLRATRGPANVYLQEFHDLGLPAYAELGTGYFAAVEVQTMLALLQVIDNPRQDIPLAAVLRSPLYGLNAEGLARIRLAAPQGDFLDAVRAAAHSGHPPADVLQRFLADLERWRTLARRRSVAHLIWSIYRETGYPSYVRGLPGGPQRQANLQALYDRARQFERTSLRGLFRFLLFIGRLQEEGADLGAAHPAGENENVVRIMSIHRAKGLEFPVVVVAGLGRRFNRSDRGSDLLLHKQLGFGPNLVDPDMRLAYPTLARHAVARRLEAESLAEELRLLYVAMTRARERLLLFGSAGNLRRAATQWCRLTRHPQPALPDAYLLSARTPLDWLGGALARHPAADPIRRLAGAALQPGGPLADDPSTWSIHLVDVSDAAGTRPTVVPPGPLNAVREGCPVKQADAATLQAAARVLDWTYPLPAATVLPAKVTVTEVQGRFAALQAEEGGPADRTFSTPVSSRPRFLLSKGALTGPERGAAWHAVMQHLDLQRPLDAADIADQLAAMVSRELLLPAQAAAVDSEAVAAFFASPLGLRVRAARGVWRELPFSLALPATEIYGDRAAGLTGEAVLVQGIIDCLIEEENGQLVLIDFKTERARPGDTGTVKARYEGQLALYARAVKGILGRPVAQRYLYLFSLGEEIEL
ncbi:MAG: helicase-exonuclease AddAB subunit AddA [Bacillota bacterium]|nr:helicase-exonuclease AddAB subunit AddA [Bacillota bacterium]